MLAVLSELNLDKALGMAFLWPFGSLARDFRVCISYVSLTSIMSKIFKYFLWLYNFLFIIKN